MKGKEYRLKECTLKNFYHCIFASFVVRAGGIDNSYGWYEPEFDSMPVPLSRVFPLAYEISSHEVVGRKCIRT